MAQKTKSKGFSRFLDFIGLVDSEEDEMFEEEAPKARSARGDSRRGESDRSARSERSSRDAGRSRERDFDDDRYSRSSSRSASSERSRREDDDFWRSSFSSRSEREEKPARDSYRESYREPVRESVRESAREAVREPARASESDVGNRHQTVIFHLRRFEDCRDVILALLDRKSVLLNLDPLDEATAQRVIDAMGGAAFALGALISKASDKNYLITPNNVVVANGNVEPRRKSERYL